MADRLHRRDFLGMSGAALAASPAAAQSAAGQRLTRPVEFPDFTRRQWMEGSPIQFG
ncbi:MAG: hypothetical protein OXC19_23880 [Bryobacterales bacterium]|nr:hypothetical protein [Bryobacterales bacterium]